MAQSSKTPLAHLQRLEPREAWLNEALDFTPWLAKEENFRVLGEALHFVDAVVEGTEKGIGAFSADIIARDRDGAILVENQLEQTDHNHLGQILTYLAGLDGPVKVVWVATKVRDEHRAAIDWLNANTPDQFAFFAVELEIYRIGDSAAAPYFHVAARPNEWSRHARARTRDIADAPPNDREKRYLAFWTAVADYLRKNDPSFSGAMPPKGHWWAFGIGRTHFTLNLTSAMRDKWIGVDIYIHSDSNKAVFDYFQQSRLQIEQEFGGELEWERLEGQKGSRIAVRLRDVDPADSARWPEFSAWYLTHIRKFRTCFTQRIKELDLDALAAHGGGPA